MIPPEATVHDLLCASGGVLLQGSPETRISAGVSTDSRNIVPGCCFIALKGERFDGNEYAVGASAGGAAVVVVSRRMEGISPECAVILTDDTLVALQRIAAWWRECLEPVSVAGVTGSSGKTSTKDMLYSILRRKFRTTATAGNFNNHIGVPLSILSTPRDTEAAVWEAGMNHAGELEPLCRLIRPRIGIISSIGSAHIEYLRTRRAIAEEKCTMARALPSDGCMIYPADCEFADLIASSTKAETLPVGFQSGRVRAERLRMDLSGCSYDLVIEGCSPCPVSLPVPGVHMAANSLLAAAAAWKFGMSPEEIADGLTHVTLTSGRLRVLNAGGVTVIDDSYNANPESVKASLVTLSDLPVSGRRVAVLGSMGELGNASREAHFCVGQLAREHKIDLICVVGQGEEAEELARGAHGLEMICSPDPIRAAEDLSHRIHPGDAVLFKASHSVHIERCMNILFPTLK